MPLPDFDTLEEVKPPRLPDFDSLQPVEPEPVEQPPSRPDVLEASPGGIGGLLSSIRTSEPVRRLLGPTDIERQSMAGGVSGSQMGLAEIPETMLKFTSAALPPVMNLYEKSQVLNPLTYLPEAAKFIGAGPKMQELASVPARMEAGVTKGLLSFPMAPLGAASGAGKAAQIASKVVMGVFGADFLSQQPEVISQVYHDVMNGKYGDAAEVAANDVLQGLAMAAGTAHAFKAEPKPRTTATPERQVARVEEVTKKIEETGFKPTFIDTPFEHSDRVVAVGKKGEIVVSRPKLQEYLDEHINEGITEEDAINRLVNHESIHSATKLLDGGDAQAAQYWEDLSWAEKQLQARIILGAKPSKPGPSLTRYNERLANTENMGHEAIRHQLEKAGELGATEFIGHSHGEALTSRTLSALSDIVSWIRKGYGTDASIRQRQLLGKITETLEAAKKGAFDASREPSTEGVPEPEVRAPVGEETPLRQQGEAAPAQAAAPAEVAQEAQVPLTEPTAEEPAKAAEPTPVEAKAEEPAQTQATHISGETLKDEIKRNGGDANAAANKILIEPAKKALEEGHEVTLYVDGTAVPVKAVENGMFVDPKGQKWGTLPIAMGKEGTKTGLDIRPKAAEPAPAQVVGSPKGKNMPEWVREAMKLAGLDPNRPLNEVDLADPKVQEAIKNDPALTEEQKQQILKTGSAKKPTKAKVKPVITPADDLKAKKVSPTVQPGGTPAAAPTQGKGEGAGVPKATTPGPPISTPTPREGQAQVSPEQKALDDFNAEVVKSVKASGKITMDQIKRRRELQKAVDAAAASKAPGMEMKPRAPDENFDRDVLSGLPIYAPEHIAKYRELAGLMKDRENLTQFMSAWGEREKVKNIYKGESPAQEYRPEPPGTEMKPKPEGPKEDQLYEDLKRVIPADMFSDEGLRGMVSFIRSLPPEHQQTELNKMLTKIKDLEEEQAKAREEALQGPTVFQPLSLDEMGLRAGLRGYLTSKIEPVNIKKYEEDVQRIQAIIDSDRQRGISNKESEARWQKRLEAAKERQAKAEAQPLSGSVASQVNPLGLAEPARHAVKVRFKIPEFERWAKAARQVYGKDVSLQYLENIWNEEVGDFLLNASKEQLANYRTGFQLDWGPYAGELPQLNTWPIRKLAEGTVIGPKNPEFYKLAAWRGVDMSKPGWERGFLDKLKAESDAELAAGKAAAEEGTAAQSGRGVLRMKRRWEKLISALYFRMVEASQRTHRSKLRPTITVSDLSDQPSQLGAYFRVDPVNGKNEAFLSTRLDEESAGDSDGTKRITVAINDKTGDVDAVSTYKYHKSGEVMLYDPNTAPNDKSGEHIKLGDFLKTHTVIASVLVNHPVYRFHQRWGDIKGEGGVRSKTGLSQYLESFGHDAEIQSGGGKMWQDMNRKFRTEAQRQRFDSRENEYGLEEDEVQLLSDLKKRDPKTLTPAEKDTLLKLSNLKDAQDAVAEARKAIEDADAADEAAAEAEPKTKAKKGEEEEDVEDHEGENALNLMDAQERYKNLLDNWIPPEEEVGAEKALRNAETEEEARQVKSVQDPLGRDVRGLLNFYRLGHLREKVQHHEIKALADMFNEHDIKSPGDISRVLIEMGKRAREVDPTTNAPRGFTGKDFTRLSALDKIVRHWQNALIKNTEGLKKDLISRAFDLGLKTKDYRPTFYKELREDALSWALEDIYVTGKSAQTTGKAWKSRKGQPYDTYAIRAKLMATYGDTTRSALERLTAPQKHPAGGGISAPRTILGPGPREIPRANIPPPPTPEPSRGYAGKRPAYTEREQLGPPRPIPGRAMIASDFEAGKVQDADYTRLIGTELYTGLKPMTLPSGPERVPKKVFQGEKQKQYLEGKEGKLDQAVKNRTIQEQLGTKSQFDRLVDADELRAAQRRQAVDPTMQAAMRNPPPPEEAVEPGTEEAGTEPTEGEAPGTEWKEKVSHGVANRYREKLASEGRYIKNADTDPKVAEESTMSIEQRVKEGQHWWEQAGGDAEGIMAKVKANQGRFNYTDEVACRYQDRLYLEAADQAAKDHGPTSQEYKDAVQFYTDFANLFDETFKPEASHIMHALQGIEDTETFSFTRIVENVKKANRKQGKPAALTPEQQQVATELLDEYDDVERMTTIQAGGVDAAAREMETPPLTKKQKAEAEKTETLLQRIVREAAEQHAKEFPKKPPSMAMKGGTESEPKLSDREFDLISTKGMGPMFDLVKAGELSEYAWKKIMLDQHPFVGAEDLNRLWAETTNKYERFIVFRLGTGSDTEPLRMKMTLKKATPEVSRRIIWRAWEFNPKGKQISTAEAFHVWNFIKQTYLKPTDPFLDFSEILRRASNDLGLVNDKGEVVKQYPHDRLYRAISTNKSFAKLTDEMFKAMAKRRDVLAKAKGWVRNQEYPTLMRRARYVPRWFFMDKIAGHGFVPMLTHAPSMLFNPWAWKAYFPAWRDMYKMAFDAGYHERMMQAVTDHQRYRMWTKKNIDLKIAPNKYSDDYSIANLNHFFRNVLKGRGFDALKTLRLTQAERMWDALPDHLKTEAYAELIAGSVNHATGITSVRIPELANWTFFAPNLELSRWAWVFGDTLKAASYLTNPKYMKNWRTNPTPQFHWAMSEVKQKAVIVGAYAGLLALNQGLLAAAGSKQKVNFTDPRRNDFLSFKAFGMKIGLAGPLIGTVRILADLLHIGYGKRKPIEMMQGRQSTGKERMAEYVAGKASPITSALFNVAFQQDFKGRPMPWSKDRVTAAQRARGITPYSGLEYGLQTFSPIPAEELAAPISQAVRESWKGIGMSDATILKFERALIAGAAMGATGARIQEEPKRH